MSLNSLRGLDISLEVLYEKDNRNMDNNIF